MIQQHPDTAYLIRGFEGGYKFRNPTPGDPDPEDPQPGNPWRDQMDTIRYLVLNFGGKARPNAAQTARLLAVSRSRVRPPRRYVV